MARWWKKMSRTDAQQPTKGYPVAYLRLTQNQSHIDPDVWFKEVLFEGITWTPGHFGENNVEEAEATFQVYDGAADLGRYTFKLTHDDHRPLNHKHPTTWIHWGPLQAFLKEHNREDWYVIVERGPSTPPQLTLRFVQQKPTWQPAT